MSTIKCNYHTHSCLCDGKDSLEHMAETALKKGFDVLGFSGHSFTAYDISYCMSKDDTVFYIDEIKRLKKEYEGRMEILCGIEQDFGSDEPVDGYDYVIGSVHAMFPYATSDSADNFHGYDRSRYFYVDWTYERIEEAVNGYFNGDPYAFCEHYFESVAKLPEVTGCNIIGHFDLVTKFSDKHDWFDQNHPRYIAAAEKALDILIAQGMIFEINTGAIAKQYRSIPYPADWMLRRIYEKGGQIMINSDCHNADLLDCWFEQAASLAKECGFTSVKKITSAGIEDFPL